MAKQAAKQPAKKAGVRVTKTTRSRRQESQEDGPLYAVIADSFIDQKLVQAGKSVVYFGLPGRALRPINGEAKARKTAVLQIQRNPDLNADQKQARLRDLSDEWNGVEAPDAFDEDFEYEGSDVEQLVEQAETDRKADQEEADRRAKLTESGQANKGADAGQGGKDMEAAKKFT